jgi:hypothetical protein
MVIESKLEIDNLYICLIFLIKILKVKFAGPNYPLHIVQANFAQWRFQIDLPSDPFGWRIDDC